MKPGRPKRGESSPSAKVTTWLEPEHLALVQQRGGSGYVRQLLLNDLPTRIKPVDEPTVRPGRNRFKVVVLAELKAQIMAAGGSAYVRYLVRQACLPVVEIKHLGIDEYGNPFGEVRIFENGKNEVLRE